MVPDVGDGLRAVDPRAGDEVPLVVVGVVEGAVGREAVAGVRRVPRARPVPVGVVGIGFRRAGTRKLAVGVVGEDRRPLGIREPGYLAVGVEGQGITRQRRFAVSMNDRGEPPGLTNPKPNLAGLPHLLHLLLQCNRAALSLRRHSCTLDRCATKSSSS